MNEDSNASADHIDVLRDQWARELPELDTAPMAILGRAYRLSSLVRPGIEATFAGFGLDRGEFDVISTLRRSGPPYRLAPTDLYRSLMISSGGLTHRLDRLEKGGLVSRVPSKADGRSLLVELTEEGRKRAEDAFRADMDDERRHLNALTRDEQADLAALLRKLLSHVEATAD